MLLHVAANYHVNLLFAIDRNFIQLLVNCTHSIARSGGYDTYDAYILNSDLSDKDKEYIQTGTPDGVTCHFVDVDWEMFSDYPETKRYPQQIYYRIAAPLLLPPELDSMVYNLSDRILAFYNADPKNNRRDVDWVREHTAIVHYCGRIKPWKEKYVGVLDVFYDELLSYMQ